MDNVEILPTDVITDSLPPLPEIPDFPDIPENVIIVPAAPLPITSECLSYPPRHSTTTTVTGAHTQLTYVTQGNVSYRYQPHPGMASNAATTTINVPTATEASIKPPTLVLAHRSRQAESSGPSTPKKQKTDETVFLTPLPVTGHARPLTRITRNIPKPKPSSDPDQNQIIKALLAQKSTPYLTRVSAPRHRNFIVRASTQTPGKTNILNLPVSASMPVSLANSPPGTPARPLHAQNAVLLAQHPNLRSAFVKTTTAADFIPRSSSVDTVITAHVTTTTAITTPMTGAPQLTYAISPIRVAATEGTTVAKTVTTSTGQSIVLISTPSPKTRAGATQSKTYVPVQHLYKAKPDAAAAAKKIHNLVRSKALPDSARAIVTTPASITMLGPHRLITTTAGVATSVQRPSVNTRAKTHNYSYLEPGEITQIHKLRPRSFPGPRSTCVARQASAAVAMQQQATIISKMKAARHAQHHAESQAMSGLELGPAREMQHAASLAALQEASHARLVAASQEARLKAQQQALFQAKIQAVLGAQKTASTSPATTQAQALPAPLHFPVTTQLQIAALGPTQTVSLAQPHGTLNVQLLTPAQAQLLANAKAQFHATSQGQILGIPQTQRVSYSQAQGLAATRPQNESLVTTQLQGQPLANSQLQGQPLAAFRPQNEYLATSPLQGQLLASSEQPDQPLATSKSQGHHLATSQAQLLATSQSQSPILITSQRQAQRLTKSQSQGPTLVPPQGQALLATTQSQSQLLATSQAQSHATLPTQLNVTHPVQIKSTQANATLIAQLNAPPQKIISKGQQNLPRLQYHATPAQLKKITQAQLNAITQAQIKTSQRRQQAASPTQIQMISSLQQNAAHGQSSPRTRRRLIITTANPAVPIDKTPVTQSDTNETVAASTSLNELPITPSASQQIGDVPSSSIHTTSTLTLSTGTTLIMPHYKTTVFKNLSSIGRAEPTQLPTPTTTSGERMVVRRSATYFPARRTFPTTTQSSTATTITTPKTTTTATTTPVIHIIRTVPRHMLASLQTGNARVRPDNSEIPTYIITQNKSKSEEK